MTQEEFKLETIDVAGEIIRLIAESDKRAGRSVPPMSKVEQKQIAAIIEKRFGKGIPPDTLSSGRNGEALLHTPDSPGEPSQSGQTDTGESGIDAEIAAETEAIKVYPRPPELKPENWLPTGEECEKLLEDE